MPSSVSWCVCVHRHSLEMTDNRVAKKTVEVFFTRGHVCEWEPRQAKSTFITSSWRSSQCRPLTLTSHSLSISSEKKTRNFAHWVLRRPCCSLDRRSIIPNKDSLFKPKVSESYTRYKFDTFTISSCRLKWFAEQFVTSLPAVYH